MQRRSGAAAPDQQLDSRVQTPLDPAASGADKAVHAALVASRVSPSPGSIGKQHSGGWCSRVTGTRHGRIVIKRQEAAQETILGCAGRAAQRKRQLRCVAWQAQV